MAKYYVPLKVGMIVKAKNKKKASDEDFPDLFIFGNLNDIEKE